MSKKELSNFFLAVVRLPLSLIKSWRSRPAKKGWATDASGLKLRRHHKVA
jgi:hypothetical protein